MTWHMLHRTGATAVAALLVVLASVAWAAQWQLGPAKSRLSFSGFQAGTPFEGWFETFSAQIRFDESDLSASRILVTIDMTSARTGNAQRDEALKGQEWFAVAAYPQGRFETKAIRDLGGGRYEADADLTIRDSTRPVVLPFTLTKQDGGTRAQGELVINRTDFGIGQGQWASPQLVAHEVRIRVDLLARVGP